IKSMLQDSGIEKAEFDAKQILSYVCGVDLTNLILEFDESLTQKQENQTMDLVLKRAERYPLQYLLGQWEFYSREYYVGEGVLIPRADTEVLCETVIKLAKEVKEPKIADLCSGSGCIAITLYNELKTQNPNVFAVEKSDNAIEYLNKNATLNNAKITVIKDDVLNPSNCDEIKDLDFIVSNPPYLTKEDMVNLQSEVKHEPSMALYGDKDGLLFYKEITRTWKNRLKDGGYIAFEIGINQHDEVKEILEQNGFKNVCFCKDVCGIIRVVYASK
ncbi:MAG: peptide chain release factor N(5)-glutamine methyltransferase, partial [Oscillospiraceae bacterium]|nr:peptide chain release factor N(5)-glutamine methyltransferase [Oscillospiraceae bacterium]